MGSSTKSCTWPWEAILISAMIIQLYPSVECLASFFLSAQPEVICLSLMQVLCVLRFCSGQRKALPFLTAMKGDVYLFPFVGKNDVRLWVQGEHFALMRKLSETMFPPVRYQ